MKIYLTSRYQASLTLSTMQSNIFFNQLYKGNLRAFINEYLYEPHLKFSSKQKCTLYGNLKKI